MDYGQNISQRTDCIRWPLNFLSWFFVGEFARFEPNCLQAKRVANGYFFPNAIADDKTKTLIYRHRRGYPFKILFAFFFRDYDTRKIFSDAKILDQSLS